MTQEEINMFFDMAREAMDGSLDHLKRELTKISTGKASPTMLQGILVSYYGAPTPLQQVANVSISDARSLIIQPWEKSILPDIERAIFEANLGITPQNDGEIVRLNIPPLTEERRREFAKKAKAYGEDAKVGVRSARRELIDSLKAAVKEGYPEDMGKRKEEEAQNLTNSYGTRIDEMVNAKEKDIMTL